MELAKAIQLVTILAFIGKEYVSETQATFSIYGSKETNVSTVAIVIYMVAVASIAFDTPVWIAQVISSCLVTMVKTEMSTSFWKTTYMEKCHYVNISVAQAHASLLTMEVNSSVIETITTLQNGTTTWWPYAQTMMLSVIDYTKFYLTLGGAIAIGIAMDRIWMTRVSWLLWCLKKTQTNEQQVATVLTCTKVKEVKNILCPVLLSPKIAVIAMCLQHLNILKCNTLVTLWVMSKGVYLTMVPHRKMLILLLLLLQVTQTNAWWGEQGVPVDYLLPIGNYVMVLGMTVFNYASSVLAIGVFTILDYAFGVILGIMFINFTSTRMRNVNFFIGCAMILLAKVWGGSYAGMGVIVLLQACNWMAMIMSLRITWPSLIWSVALFNAFPIAKYFMVAKLPGGAMLSNFFDLEVPSYIGLATVFGLIAIESIPQITTPIVVQKRNLLTGKVLETNYEAGLLTKLLLGDYIPTFDLMISQCGAIGAYVNATGPRSLGLLPVAKKLLYWNKLVQASGKSLLVTDHRPVGIVKQAGLQMGVCFVAKLDEDVVIMSPIHVTCDKQGHPFKDLEFHFPALDIIIKDATLTVTVPGHDQSIWSTNTELPVHLGVTLKLPRENCLYVGYKPNGTAFSKVIKVPVGGVAINVRGQPGESGSILINPENGRVFGQLWCTVEESHGIFVGLNPAAILTKHDLNKDKLNIVVVSNDMVKARQDIKQQINTITGKLANARAQIMDSCKSKAAELKEANEKLHEIELEIEKAESAIPVDLVFEHKLYTALVQQVVDEMGDHPKTIRLWRTKRQQALKERNDLAVTDTSSVTALRQQLRSLNKDLGTIDTEIKASMGHDNLEANDGDQSIEQNRMPTTVPLILYPIIANMGSYYRIWWGDTEIQDITIYPVLDTAVVERVKAMCMCTTKQAKKRIMLHIRSRAWAVEKMQMPDSLAVKASIEAEPKIVQQSFMQVVQYLYDKMSPTNGPRSTCHNCGRRFECSEAHVHDDKCLKQVVGNAERHGVWCNSNWFDGTTIIVEGTKYMVKDHRIGLYPNIWCTRVSNAKHKCIINTKPDKYHDYTPINGVEECVYLENRCMEHLIKKIHEAMVRTPENDSQEQMLRLIDMQNQERNSQTRRGNAMEKRLEQVEQRMEEMNEYFFNITSQQQNSTAECEYWMHEVNRIQAELDSATKMMTEQTAKLAIAELGANIATKHVDLGVDDLVRCEAKILQKEETIKSLTEEHEVSTKRINELEKVNDDLELTIMRLNAFHKEKEEELRSLVQRHQNDNEELETAYAAAIGQTKDLEKALTQGREVNKVLQKDLDDLKHMEARYTEQSKSVIQLQEELASQNKITRELREEVAIQKKNKLGMQQQEEIKLLQNAIDLLQEENGKLASEHNRESVDLASCGSGDENSELKDWSRCEMPDREALIKGPKWSQVAEKLTELDKKQLTFDKAKPKTVETKNKKLAMAKERDATRMHSVIAPGKPASHKRWLQGEECGCHMCICSVGNCLCEKQYCLWCSTKDHNTVDCKHAYNRTCAQCDKAVNMNNLSGRKRLCCEADGSCFFCGNGHNAMCCPVRNKAFWDVPKDRRLFPPGVNWTKIVQPPYQVEKQKSKNE